MQRRQYFIAILGVILVGCLTWYMMKPDTDVPVLLIYQAAGDNNVYNQDMRNGIELALSEGLDPQGKLRINNKPHRVQLIPLDHGDSTDEITANLKQAIEKYHPALIVGTVRSMHAIPASKVAEHYKTPFISPTASAVAYAYNKPFVFPAAPTNDVQAEAVAYFAVKQLHARRVAIFYNAEDTNYSADLGKKIHVAFSNLSGQSAWVKGYSSTTEFQSLAQQTTTFAPDVIMLLDYEQMSSQLISLLRGYYAGPVMGGDTWGVRRSPLWKNISNIYWINEWSPQASDTVNQQFIMKYTEKYSRAPTNTSAMAYDTCIRVMKALHTAKGITPQEIRDALENIRTQDGVAGHYVFNNDNAVKDYWVMKLTNGSISESHRISPGGGISQDTPM